MAKETDRLRELMLYLAQEMERTHHAGRGRIKLSKLAWRSDFAAYWLLGEPITGVTYTADELGPKPQEEYSVTEAMIEDGIFTWDNDWDTAKRPKALRKPDLKGVGITKDQQKVIDRQLEENQALTGEEMKDAAHKFPGYIHAWEGEGGGRDTVIPYESVFWDDAELEPWEHEHAAAIVAAD